MSLEIERKFLVKNCAFLEESFEKKHLVQGFLNSDKNRTVRVRIDGLKSFLTVKGPVKRFRNHTLLSGKKKSP
jgi:CYTH domain-containing protein